jgi:DME family drug/metabolite transporter
LLGNYLLTQTDLSSFGLGHVLVLAAALFWAIENVISKKLLENINGTVLAFGRMFFGSIFILAYLGSQNSLSPVLAMDTSQWLWTLLSSALLLAYVLTWYNGLKYVPVTTATIILLLASPITMFLNILILQKSIGIYEITGTLIITVSVIVLLLISKNNGSLIRTRQTKTI